MRAHRTALLCLAAALTVASDDVFAPAGRRQIERVTTGAR
jgi:hypothetical protein